MGSIASASKGTELTAARPQDGISHLLAHNWGRISKVLPKHMSAERLYQLSVSAINQTPELAQATSRSLLSCVMRCSALGLEPSAVDGLGRAYILPYHNRKTGFVEAQVIIGYKGMIDLARRSGQLKSIHAQAVYEGDEYRHWEDETGQHFTFNPVRGIDHSPEKCTDAYVCAQLVGGGFVFETMTREEIEDVRKRSKASKYGPWVTDWVAMALKTVIRRSFRYLPVSVEAQTAVASDEVTPDYSGVLDPAIPDGEDDADEITASVDADTGEVVEPDIADEDFEFGPSDGDAE